MIRQANFTHSPLEKDLEKHCKTIKGQGEYKQKQLNGKATDY